MSQIGVDFFPMEAANRTHSRGYAEDLPAQGEKDGRRRRC
ncbi:hypothetical protein HMPREF9166_1996 [Selenomonas sp. oral taxon 149 str. 67H29BP]|nr:hypothetical protein HMPREF9166_1996 [Selenomonas sp. oral taxon 149 str. 67H29BP]